MFLLMAALVKPNFYDLTGEKATCQFHLAAAPDQAAVDAMADALNGVSAAGITKVDVVEQSFEVVGVAVAGDYDDAGDKLVLVFQGAAGGIYKVSIPAPKATCFLADKESLDMTVVGPQITAIINNCVGSNGGALTFLRGYRSKNRRKH